MIAAILLSLAGLYLLCGFIFAIPFVLVGVGKIDPHAAHGSWGFRILILPGTTLLWPLLAKRWIQGVHAPLEEKNAHRLNAECKMQNAKCSRRREEADLNERAESVRLLTSAATGGGDAPSPSSRSPGRILPSAL